MILGRLRRGIHEFCYTLLAFPRAWRFMLRHRLWVGLRDYGWVARALTVFGVLLSLYVLSEVIDWFGDHAADPLYSMAIGSDSLLSRLGAELYESLDDGALNWIILILLEVVTYHFMRRTLAVVLQRDTAAAHTFQPFFRAQLRMIKFSLLGFVAQTLLVDVLPNLIPFVDLTPVLAWVVPPLLLGYAIADNYNEQFDLTIRQSIRYLTRNYVGICLGLGVPLTIMLKVPVVGAVLGPLVTAVTAGIVLRERSDLHIMGYRMSEKERREADKRLAKAQRKAARRARKSSPTGLP